MGQSFEYQNLLTGTRSAGGFANVAHGDNLIPRVTLAAAPGGWAYALSNATDKEKFAISRETFRLRHGVPYSLSLWAAVTGNMASMDIFVLAYGTSDDGWVAAGRSVIAPASGGGVALLGFLPPRGEQGGLGLLPALRQQREQGRQGVDALDCGPHALRGHGAARVGAGIRGGVALSER